METSSSTIQVGVNFASSTQMHWIRSYYTVDPNDVIVSKWDLIRQEVLGVIKELPWAVLSVVRSSFNVPNYWDPERNALVLDDFEPPEPMPEPNPIILVGACADSQDSWQAMAERIYRLCTNAGLGHCRVLFQSAGYPLTASTESGPYNSCDVDQFPMGSSFGPVSGVKESTASMGGTIKLKEDDKGKESTLLLSVFHPFSKLVTDEERRDGWRHDPDSAIELQMPSTEDTNQAKNRLQNLVANMRSCIEDNKGAKEITAEKQMANEERFRRKIERCEGEIQKLEDHANNHRGRGLLQYGSGLGRGFDWSLSAFNHRKINNFPPAENDVEEALKTREIFTEEAIHKFRARYDDSKEIELARAESNSLVIKQGRTTGLTVGMVNTLPSDIVMSKTIWGFNKEIVIGVRAILRKYPFVERGDSGAWVLNSDGDWIGSVIGVQTNQKYSDSIGLVMEAESIVEDIEKFTGAKVINPRRKGQEQR